jgi:ankyrin repeat protein
MLKPISITTPQNIAPADSTITSTNAAPPSPRTAVLRDHNLLAMITAGASKPTSSALPTSSWNLSIANSYGRLRSVNKAFRRVVPDFAHDALEKIKQGDITPATLLSCFSMRLARSRLPQECPDEESRQKLRNTLMTGMNNHAPSSNISAAVDVFLDVAFDRPNHIGSEPQWGETVFMDDDDAYVYKELANNVDFSLRALKLLSQGNVSLSAIDSLVTRYKTDTQQAKLYNNFMFAAAQSGAWDTVKLLLETGKAQVVGEANNYLDDVEFYQHAFDYISLSDIYDSQKSDRSLLHIAAEQGDLDTLAYLHSKTPSGVSLIDQTDGEGRTPLFFAAEAGNKTAFEWLVDQGASIVVRDEEARSLLHVVRDPAIAQFLIEAGLNVNARAHGDSTPLHHQRNPKIAQLLIQAGADVNASSRRGSVFYTASPAIKVIVSQATDFSVVTALRGRTTPDDVRMLLSTMADPNETDEYGDTALHCVNSEEAMTTLLKAKAPMNVLNDDGYSVIVRSNLEHTMAVAQKLFNASQATQRLDEFRELLDRPDNTGRSLLLQHLDPMEDAIRNTDTSCEFILSEMDSALSSARTLVKWGANPNAKSPDRNSAYDCAVGYLDTVSREIANLKRNALDTPATMATLNTWKQRLTELVQILSPSVTP